MDLRVDNRVHAVRTPSHDVALPAIDGLVAHEPALLDRVGGQVQERWPLLLAGAALGGVGAAGLGGLRGHGLPGRIGAGLVGVLAGATAIAGAAAGIERIVQGSAPKVSAARAPGAATAAERIRADDQLRVMTFNLHAGKGEQGSQLGDDADMERIARAIERERPDVVLLQEVDRFAAHNGFRDMLGELADRLDADGAVHTPSATNVTGRESGTAVLTFNGVEVADARAIVSPDVHGSGVLRRIGGLGEYRPRATADVLVTTPAGNAVRVLSGHWSWPADGIDQPARQVYPLAGLLGAWEGPTIIGGDFNVRSETAGYLPEAAAFADAGLRDAFTAQGIGSDDARRATFGSGDPGASLDRVYGSDRLQVDDVRVATFPDDELAPSDHHPLVVDYGLVAD